MVIFQQILLKIKVASSLILEKIYWIITLKYFNVETLFQFEIAHEIVYSKSTFGKFESFTIFNLSKKYRFGFLSFSKNPQHLASIALYCMNYYNKMQRNYSAWFQQLSIVRNSLALKFLVLPLRLSVFWVCWLQATIWSKGKK